MQTILQVKDVSVGLQGRRSVAEVVRRANLNVNPGEILGLVGESGCGKSTLIMSILRLAEPPVVPRGGQALLSLPSGQTVDLLSLPEAQLRRIRWRHISYIPQGSMSALNPVLRVRRQMTDTLIEHGLPMREALERAQQALELVNLRPDVLDRYPHELSGGMMQRVAIAMAMAMRPELIIADEPTTALDVVTQRSILQGMMRIRSQLGTTMLLVSHDMGVMAEVVDRMAVMYAGRIVEVGPVMETFQGPLHPYAQGLIKSIPKRGGGRVVGLAGESPSPWRCPPGCSFHPRCPQAMEKCKTEMPETVEYRPGRLVACHLYTT